MTPHDQLIPHENLPQGADYQLANSFKNFLYKVWMELFNEAPSELQYEVADFLQYGGPKSQLLAFRGFGKSYMTAPFTTWCLYREPNDQILTTSATGSFAAANARFAYSMITNFNWLSHMRPRHDQASSATDFDVRSAQPAKGTSFAARSITGQITGLRADVIVGDDVETPNTSATPGAREELRHRIAEFGAIIKPGGKILYLGTAQCEETVYVNNELKGYNTLIVPCYYPTPEEIDRYGAHRLPKCILKALQDNPDLAGTSVEARRFSDEDLAGRRVEFGETEFIRQFKMFMDGAIDGESPLMLRNIPVLELSPYDSKLSGTGIPSQLRPPTLSDPHIELAQMGIVLDALSNDNQLWSPRDVSNFKKPSETVMHIDPSGSGKDETAWSISASKNGRVFILDVEARLEGHNQATLEAIALSCVKWGVNTVIVEGNFGDGMFEALLRPILKGYKHACHIETRKVGKQFKEARICNILEPTTTARRVILNLDIFRKDIASTAYTAIADNKRRFYRFCYQLTRMKKVRGCLSRDDRVDAVASSVSYWTEHMEVVAEEKQEEDRVAAILAEFQRYLDSDTTGISQRQATELEQLLGINTSDPFGGKVSHSAKYS